MKKLFVTLLIVLFSANISLAANKVSVDENGVALKGYDLISVWEKSKPVMGDPSYMVEHEGAKYYFMSADYMKKFQADPMKYLPQYGGYCAFALANGKLVGADPNYNEVVDGKLYLNLSAGAKEKWMKDIPGNIMKADENWAKMMN